MGNCCYCCGCTCTDSIVGDGSSVYSQEHGTWCNNKTLLRDHTIALAWYSRVTFASDIARGMCYLHERGIVHRDLKADNCFYDEKSMRVKVADFGTGHIREHILSKERTPPWSFSMSVHSPTLASSDAPRDQSRTLSSGGGSLMWMSPERLRGQRLKERDAKASDVYRYVLCR